MLTDLRYAIRMLLKSPGFSAVAILTLALGIGANTAIFSVVEGTLLRPLPFPNADRLVRVYQAENDNGARSSTLNPSTQTVRQWLEYGSDIFEDIAFGTGTSVTVGATANEPARNILAARISANFFTVLGLPPTLGRNFTPQEDQPGGPSVAIIGYDFWQNHLGGRADILGDRILLDGVPRTVVGVMPKSFRHPYQANVWLPLALPAAGSLDQHFYSVGRLRPSITIEQAEAAVRRMCVAIDKAEPNRANPHHVYLPPLRESFVMNLRPKVMVIVGAALCALLIAAANFAGLLFGRVVEREGEFALRAALGASRIQLVRQQLVQAMLLAILGTVLGLLIAGWTTPALFVMSPEGSDVTGSAMREFDYAARMDWPVLGFATGVMLFVGVVFGLLPAARASRTDLRTAMSASSRGATLDRGSRRLLGTLVVVELAIAAALLMASLTATQYFRKLLDEPWGFETENRIAFRATFSDRLFPDATSKQASLEATLNKLRSLPGVEGATVTTPPPLNAPWFLLSCNPEGAPPPEPRGFYLAYLRCAVPGYFQTLGQSLLRGREFLETDTADSPPVCIVSEDLADRFWPGQNPIGKRVKWGRLDAPRPWLTVVGVVANMKVVTDPRDGDVIGMVARPLPQMISLRGQVEDLIFILHTKTTGPIDATIRAALAQVDSRLAAYDIVSLGEAARRSYKTEHFVFVLVSLFSGLGLVLAAVGLYGLLSLQVARREREFGIRSALGATASQLIQLVAKQGATLLGIGLLVGTICTWGAVQIAQSRWSEMPAPNVLAWLGGGLVLCAAVVVACWIPARRASRIDPIIALRAE
jgi:putative ABC transport system permease protein